MEKGTTWENLDKIYFRVGSSSFPGGSAGKESACNAGDLGSIPGLGRSPGEGKGYPLQYSGLENSMDGIVHGVAKSQTQLSAFHFPQLKCKFSEVRKHNFYLSFFLSPLHKTVNKMVVEMRLISLTFILGGKKAILKSSYIHFHSRSYFLDVQAHTRTHVYNNFFLKLCHYLSLKSLK